MQPQISVIIPCLNEEDLLPKLLKNLQIQTLKSFEVIIVDGHSDDKTPSLIRDVQKSDSRFRLVESKRGISLQRNTGVALALGQYLLIMDADCQIPTNFLSDAVTNFAKSKLDLAFVWAIPDFPSTFQNLHIAICNWCMSISVRTHIFTYGWPTIITTPAVFAKVGGYDESITYAEDAELLRRTQKKKLKLGFLAHPRYITSLRRFRKVGFWRYYAKLIFGGYSFWLLNKKITGKNKVYNVTIDRPV